MRRVVREGVGVTTQTRSTLYTGHVGLDIELVAGISSLLQSLNVFVQMVPTCSQGLSSLGKNFHENGLRLTLALGKLNCPFFEKTS